jgi:hypothetical protein
MGDASNDFVVSCIRCRRNVFTTPLPSYSRRNTQGFVKYAIEMGSVAMIYVPSFIKTCSGIQDSLTHRELRDCISLLISFKN